MSLLKKISNRDIFPSKNASPELQSRLSQQQKAVPAIQLFLLKFKYFPTV